MTDTKQTRSEIKRNDILVGAQKAFKQYGVAETSVDKIAETANVSKRTLYNYFESKEVLVTHIIRDIWAKTIFGFDLVYNPNVSLKSQLLELVINEMTFCKNEELIELVRVAVGHTLFCPEEFHLELRQFFEQDTALIRWLKAACADEKFIGMEPTKAHEQILALVKGQAFWPQILCFSSVLTNEECITVAEETVELILCRYKQ